jgi:hypothetical protein
MKVLIAIVAGAVLGVSAVAGKPDAVGSETQKVAAEISASTFGTSSVEAILPVVDALRSGDAVYSGGGRAGRGDFVPPRPPL